MCEALHAEIEETLEREKFRRWITLDEAADFLAAMTLLADWVDDRPAAEIPNVCDDPDDNFLIALCQDADTGILVSGDEAVRRVKYPNILVYSPTQAISLLAFRHEWGEGYIPSDLETSRRQLEAEGSTAILTAWASFAMVFNHVHSGNDAEPFLQLVAVPDTVPQFVAEFDDIRNLLRDRGVGSRPWYVSPEVVYLKLPPDPKVHLVSTAEKLSLPPDTIFATLQRCLDLPDDPDLAVDHWRVFGIGQWPLEQIPQRPTP
jgi:hypothetical protein